MRRWLDSDWYAHLWRRLSRRVSIFVLLPALAVLATGGFAVAYSVRGAGSTTTRVVRLQAVKKHVRIHGQDKTVTRYVTLATTDLAKPATVVQTHVVTRPVIQTVQAPTVVQRHLVYVTGRGATVTREHVLTATQTQTQTKTQVTTETNVEMVTQPTTITDSKTVTRRVTTTEPAQTVTLTGAILTVTITSTKTVTHTTTVTAPATTTK